MREFDTPEELLLANQIYTTTALNGGISINRNSDSPVKGFLVSVRDWRCFDSISEVDVHSMSKWIKEETLGEKEYFGGWLDKETGKVYFDISTVTKDLETAMRIARDNSQIAIWDIEGEKEVKL